eukprot:8929063-Karenia_brevis.AAC.1
MSHSHVPPQGGLADSNNFENVAWWDNFLRSQSSKRNKQQPFWWFGAPKGSASGLVLKALWNSDATYYQVKVPRPELRRTHQGFTYPPKEQWKRDTMVLT